MQKSDFKEWTLDSIEEAFGLVQVATLPILNELLAHSEEIETFDNEMLSRLRAYYLSYGGDNWNEVELENKIISPIIVLSGIQSKEFSYFLERDLAITIGDYELSGKVDGMIATGFRNPKKPYFCMNEYKRGTDPNGDPQGQALIAMLAAQYINENRKPIFGSYIIGRNWYFMALVGKEYAFSTDFSCADDEIFDIFRILKSLKIQIAKLI
jgi:hypothetical protein